MCSGSRNFSFGRGFTPLIPESAVTQQITAGPLAGEETETQSDPEGFWRSSPGRRAGCPGSGFGRALAEIKTKSARQDLQGYADHDFDGPGAKVVEQLDQALGELHLALDYDKLRQMVGRR